MTDTLPLDGPSGRLWVLIPCAGSGSRAATLTPKQYYPLCGKPLVRHTLEAFSQVPEIVGIVVVVSAGDTAFEAPDLAGSWIAVPCGGQTRAQSVANGLRWLAEHRATANDWVLVHDAARCLITPSAIAALISLCKVSEAGGLLAHRLADTLKQQSPTPPARVASTIDRAGKWLAQTPQMFRLGPLQKALQQAGESVTDESSAMEAVGESPLLVEGGVQNFKVTFPDDFELAQAVLELRNRSTQQGHTL